MKNSQKKSGYTIIELIIYMAIIGVVMVSFIEYSISVSSARTEAYTVEEVQSNVRSTLQIIRQYIHASTGIDGANSSFGTDPGVLVLYMADSSKNPTTISVDANKVLEVKEGGFSPVAVTSDEVRVERLVFTNLTPIGERESVRVELTISYRVPAGESGKQFQFSKSVETAVTVRQ